MSDEPHAQYERMAFDHVRGGLDDRQASGFRNHLVGCRACRAQVAELRDIAAHLEQTAASERRTADTKIEVARREPDPEPPPVRAVPAWVRRVGVVILALTIGGVLFWNLHLRSVVMAAEITAHAKDGVLATLAVGTPLVTELAPNISGLVAIDASTVAVDLVGLPVVPEGYALVLWLPALRSPEVIPRRALGPGGRLAFTFDVAKSSDVLISLELVGGLEEPGDGPTGIVLMRAHVEAS